MRTAFVNVRLVTADGILGQHTVLVEDGTIALVEPDGFCMLENTEVIDAHGHYLSAGLIDLHIHGGAGFEFMDATRESYAAIASFHASHGVTTMLPAISACRWDVMLAAIDAFEAYAGGIKDCNMPGLHLEGPYFSHAQCGAQDPRYLLTPVREQYEPLLDRGCIMRFSAAPELDGALALGDALASRGILASVAHTDAYYEDILAATEHGYSLMTHLYSGMEGVRRKNAFRFGGAVEAGLLLDDLNVEIIADGRHLPECLLKLICKCKPPGKIILTSDATRGAGFADGQTLRTEGDREIIIEDGVAKLPDRSAFAGSIASGDRLVRTMVSIAGVPLYEAITMATENPARLAGLYDKKGSVEPGKDADLILFNDNIDMQCVMVGGTVVYKATT